MSLANRKKEYDKLKANGRLHLDDGCLLKEFGPKEPKLLEKNLELKKGKK